MAETPVIPIPRPRLLPWHEAVLGQLQVARAAKRLPRALLLQGAEGLGKRDFAAWFAAAVLCENSVESLQHCGQCTSCKLIAAGTHPDLMWIALEEDKQQISVDQVRAATERLGKTSFRGGYKIAVVEPAHQMTNSAANSVLKTLEEPPAESLLILITSRPSTLPATVRSRCQKITMQRPSAQDALRWLQSETGKAIQPAIIEFTGGAPLRALEFANGRFAELDADMQRSLGELLSGRSDVTQVASEWAKDALVERLVWLDLWLMSIARGAIGGSADLVTFPARSAHLPSLPQALNISDIYSMVDRARTLKAQLSRTALQRELAVESWLVYLLQAVAGVKPLAANQ
ncbi:MAG TPA: DNA polymerase III subunit delta' [Steroidobacteraceae bacterium]|jgi:DNA polymerase-3 subunit delta'